MKKSELTQGAVYKDKWSETLYQFLGVNEYGDYEFAEVEYNKTRDAYSYVDSDYSIFLDTFAIADLERA